MINYINIYVIIIILCYLVEKNATIKIRRINDYLNFIQPNIFRNITKYDLSTTFNVIREKKGKNEFPSMNNVDIGVSYINEKVLNEEDTKTDGLEKKINKNDLKNYDNNKCVINDNINEIDNISKVEDMNPIFNDHHLSTNHSYDNNTNEDEKYLNGEILNEEEINEHMKFQQWCDRFILSKDEEYYYDIQNECVNTKYYDKINQVNDNIYKEENIMEDSSIQLVPFCNRKNKEKMCQPLTKHINEKLSYDLYTNKTTDNANKKENYLSPKESNNNNNNIFDSSNEKESSLKKPFHQKKTTTLSEEEINNLSIVDMTKRTNMILPLRSLLMSIYIGKEAFNDFLQKGMNSIELSLQKYLHDYYEHNFERSIDEKVFLMFILKYIKKYILHIIYKTFQIKLQNEIDIDGDTNILSNNKKLINNELYLELNSEYEEIVNILVHFIEKLKEKYEINEEGIMNYLIKKNSIITYSTPYTFQNNEETEKHIKNIWTFFNFKIFNNKLPSFDFINFYWIYGKVDKLLNIPNMKTYKIVNQNFINLPHILLCAPLKNSPLLLNYTILKVMYEYYNLLDIDNNILPFKDVKNYQISKKFDDTKQKIIKFVHGISGLLENIDFNFYTPYIGDLNLTNKESAQFFSYLKNVVGDQYKLSYQMGYNDEVSHYGKQEIMSEDISHATYNNNNNEQNKFNHTEKGDITTNINEIDKKNNVVSNLEKNISKNNVSQNNISSNIELQNNILDNDEDDLVFLILKSKVTNDINKAINMVTDVYKKRNLNNIWGNTSYGILKNEDGEEYVSNKQELTNKNMKKKSNVTLLDNDKNDTNKLQRFRIPLNEFASSLFLCDVNNSTKYLTQGLEKLKELKEYDLTFVHNALSYTCLKFLHDCGNENEDVDSLLKKYEKNEKVETTNNIMTLQMMVVIGELFRNIRKLRTKEKYFFKPIIQTDIITDLYNDKSIYDEHMDIENMKYVMNNLKIKYPLQNNITLNDQNREEIAYYFLNYYTKHIFRFDLPNNIVIKFVDNILGLTYYDYNYDYLTNDNIIYINKNITNSLILSRVLLDECLNIYEKYTTYVHKYGGNSDSETIEKAKKKGEEQMKEKQKTNDEREEIIEELNDNNDENDDTNVNMNEEDEYKNATDYTEENINVDSINLNNIRDVSNTDDSFIEEQKITKKNYDQQNKMKSNEYMKIIDDMKKNENNKQEQEKEPIIDDENVDIFNYLKINRMRQFIRFIIEYNNWPFFLDDTINMENYLNSEELSLWRKEKKLINNNSLNNFYINMQKIEFLNNNNNRIMEIIQNSIKKEDCKHIWEQKKIPIKHIAAALYTNNYMNLYKIFQKGIHVLLTLNIDEINYIMNKCKYACEIIYYKRLEQIKSSSHNLLFTMYNENVSSIEYYFDKLKEKIILISLIKNKDIFQTLIGLISSILPNSNKGDYNDIINNNMDKDMNNNNNNNNINNDNNYDGVHGDNMNLNMEKGIHKNLSTNTNNSYDSSLQKGKNKNNIYELLFLYDKEKKRCGTTTFLNRKNVTHNLFQLFNKDIFNNKLSNVEIEFVKDDQMLSSHINYINSFQNSKIFINDNIYSVNIIANVLLKEMAEIYYFYNETKIEKENKLYLKNEFRSKYLPVIYKYSKPVLNFEDTEMFDFDQKDMTNGNKKMKMEDNNSTGNVNNITDEGNNNTSNSDSNINSRDNQLNSYNNISSNNLNENKQNDSPIKDMSHMTEKEKNQERKKLASEKDKYDIQQLIKKIALYDHDEMFKEILEFRKAKYNDNVEIQKCLEEYLFTYDKINAIKYCSSNEENNNDSSNKDDNNNNNNNINNENTKMKNDDLELVFGPNDIKTFYLSYMYKYIQYVLKKREYPINFNYVNEEWINNLTELENQKILDYSTRHNTGHLYDLLINSKACSTKRALDILNVSLQKNEDDELKETTLASSEHNNAIQNFDEYVLWFNNNKKKTFADINEQDILNKVNNTSINVEDEVRDVIKEYNEINKTEINKDIDPNSITIDNLKDLVKKHNISKEDIQAALNQLDIPSDFDINSLF
ncbi:hypothetical protein PGSY75_0520800 [Plasmodium gaboni]|uniref:Uncharacterized protein n=1 Tax=Plasmodium gaboni TaxID=647221 RepID=A0A151LT88_9APIC|nr:hypothetical protein PGSY75_0520800 [Plasmodium gaboni]KYO02404.1 hypothetical protein PGSY75_0520800 [Plasmodium gaboni]